MVRLGKIISSVLLGTVLLGIAFIGYQFFTSYTTQLGFKEYLKTHDLQVGTQNIDGRQQVYYQYQNKRVFVTRGKRNHVGPKSSRHYIAWQEETNGQSQVVLYNLLTKQSLQLSYLRNNTAISMDGSHVAWQGWIGDTAVIYFFNGQRVKKISGDYAAIRPFVGGGHVLFAQQMNASQDQWQTIEYNQKSGQSRVAVEGTSSQAAWPRLEGGDIKAGIDGSGKYY